MRSLGAGQSIDQPFGAIGLEVAPDLVELLPATAHHPAVLADVAEIARKLQQAELATCYLLLRGHVVLRDRLDVARNSILTPLGGGTATPARLAFGLWRSPRLGQRGLTVR